MSSSLAVRLGSLVDLLRERTDTLGETTAYTFLTDGEEREEHITYAQLDRRARAVAATLVERGLSGQRALLLYPPGLEYIVAYFGCLYAGVTAVPAYPPDLRRLKRSLPRLISILRDCDARAALTTSGILRTVRPLLLLHGDLRRLQWLGTDSIKDRKALEWRDPGIGPEQIAFLQYTSGSTAEPKGVVVLHGNLLDNLLRIEQSFGHSRNSQGVIWLPPYHDMGLIGGILSPLFTGFHCTLMSPLAFMHRPLRWLRAISRYRATTSGGPNFAYDLCVRRLTPEALEGLDLSSWDVAFNGAEPIRPETVRRFTQSFGDAGFQARAFYPCYGLAEATLFVTGGHKAEPVVEETFDGLALEAHRLEAPRPDSPARTLIGCGRAAERHELAIVDPDTLEPLGPDQVGEILVKGPSVTAGYWNNKEVTRETFELTVAGQGPYLRTGDLGFLRGEELFVCGRRKELIIIRGRNYYPQDIERAAEASHPALRTGCLAAFSMTDCDQDERLALVAEVRETRRLPGTEIVAAIRRAVSEAMQLKLHAVALVPRDGVRKTSSGKIQRRLTRTHYLERKLDLVHEWRD